MRCLLFALISTAILAACGAPPPTQTIAPAATLPQPTPTVAPTATALPLKITQDVVYALPLQPNDSEWKLDVYVPADGKPAPLVLFLHGFAEHKEDYARLYRLIAEQGAIAFGVEWPERAPFAIRDDNRKRYRHLSETLGCAIRFAHANYGGERAQVILMGFSAGAGAGAAIAFAGENAESAWDAFAASGGPPSQVRCVASGSSRVDAFIGIAGGYGVSPTLQQQDPGLWQIINPYSHLGENKNLRVRLLHGEFDSRVPIASTIEFNGALSKAGYDTQFIKFDQGHAVPFDLAIAELKKLWK